VVTTCELTTYEPDEDDESNEIVFSPNTLLSKIIMKVHPSSPLSPYPSPLYLPLVCRQRPSPVSILTTERMVTFRDNGTRHPESESRPPDLDVASKAAFSIIDLERVGRCRD